MEREIEIEGAACDAAAARFCSQSLDRVLRAGQRDRLACVQRADFERAAGLGEKLARRLDTQRQGRHAAAAARAFLLPAARDDDPRRVGQRQRAGRPGRADLSDAVADMRLRLDPEPAQHRDNADLHREEQRLRDVGMRQLLGVGAAFQPLADRPAQRREQGGIREADRVAERGIRPVGVAPHLRPLGAVAGKYEGELRVAHGGSGHDRGAFDPGGEIGKGGNGVGPIGAERDEALRMVLAPARRAAQQRADRLGGGRGERIAPAFRKGPQRGLGMGRNDEGRQFRFRCGGFSSAAAAR